MHGNEEGKRREEERKGEVTDCCHILAVHWFIIVMVIKIGTTLALFDMDNPGIV